MVQLIMNMVRVNRSKNRLMEIPHHACIREWFLVKRPMIPRKKPIIGRSTRKGFGKTSDIKSIDAL